MSGAAPASGAASCRGAPLLQPIAAPTLAISGHEHLKRFELARAKRIAQVKGRLAQPGGDGLQPQSLRQSIDPELLGSLAFLDALVESITKPAGAAGAAVEAWMAKILGGSSTIAKAGLGREAKLLRVNMKEKGPEQRAAQLLLSAMDC